MSMTAVSCALPSSRQMFSITCASDVRSIESKIGALPGFRIELRDV